MQNLIVNYDIGIKHTCSCISEHSLCKRKEEKHYTPIKISTNYYILRRLVNILIGKQKNKNP